MPSRECALNTDELSTVDCDEQVLIGVVQNFVREYRRLPTIGELRRLTPSDAPPG